MTTLGIFKTLTKALVASTILAGSLSASFAENAQNDILNSAKEASAINCEIAPRPIDAPADTVNSIIAGGKAAPTTTQGRRPTDCLPKRDFEAFPITNEPVSAVRLITGRPLQGESCENVLFDARPVIKERHEVTAGQTLPLRLSDLCLFEFRNDSDDRSLVLRIDQRMQVLMISGDPRLFAGLTLAPNQSISIPMRRLKMDNLSFTMDVLWNGETNPSAVQKFIVDFK